LPYFAIMKQLMGLLFLLLFLSCNNSTQQGEEKKSETDIDAARNFLDASLKGNYHEASAYMLQDSTNTGYLFYAERDYNKLPPEDKRELKEASLHFYEPTQRPNDSTTILIFSNSFRNNKDTLRIIKIIKQQGKWLVDLKYLFTHDMDTTGGMKINGVSPLPKDSSGK
jgi:hypothetical protein